MQQRIEVYNGSAFQTGKRMHWLVNNYCQDMAPYASMSLQEIFDKVKSLPFREDPDNNEVVKRPKYTMEMIGPGGDCDDKSVCIAAWAKLNGIAWNFIAVGRRKPILSIFGLFNKIPLTHVFVRLYYINGMTSIDVDATYSTNVLGLTSGGRYDREAII